MTNYITGLDYTVSREVAIAALEDWLAPHITEHQRQNERHKLEMEHYQRRCADYVRMTPWDKLWAVKPEHPDFSMVEYYGVIMENYHVESALNSMKLSNSDNITIQTHEYEGARLARIIIDYVEAKENRE